MSFVSKIWLTFVDQSDVLLDMHCSQILKRTDDERAASRTWPVQELAAPFAHLLP
jgi:hypothetical protein